MDRAAFAVSQWAREMPDLDLRAMEILGRLSELALVIRRDHLVPLFAEFGLQDGEFDVLAALRRSGAPFEMTPTELYGVTMLSSGGMTARLDRLERSGLVERRPNPADRRGTLVALSAKGREVIERALPAHSANETRILAALSPGEQEQFGALMAKLLTGLTPPG
ncbi:MarR family transcriptional regulator [Defluviimonas sp. WL0024]|uniref:MarR family transcriptional regulator n=1 Tax=Albidovulum salinarum TaxID=2984153 RepID=A0ABT2X187_9RHOB|nr:MarR family transcriptional regulator [Defluviimonas sp. WL0024]MCU9847698.1 MarR family transcriptional regulator [Defluviimonas sp. WL0024]